MKKLIIFLVIFAFSALALYAANAARDARTAQMKADSLEAAADTAELVGFVQGIDSATNIWERRVTQVELERTELARELEMRPVVHVEGVATVDTLRMTDTVMAQPLETPEDTVKTYEYEGRDGPFILKGDARLFPNGVGVFNVVVAQVDTIPVGTDIGCQDVDGFNKALVALSAQTPLHLIPGAVTQTPEVCNRTVPVFKVTKGKAMWAGVGFLIGYVVANAVDDGFRVANY